SDAGIVCLGNLAEIRTGEGGVRILEFHVVEDVEQLCPESQREPFSGKRRDFSESQIGVKPSRSTHEIAWCCSICACARCDRAAAAGKARGTEGAWTKVAGSGIGLGIRVLQWPHQIGPYKIAITGAGRTRTGHATGQLCEHVQREAGTVRENRIHLPTLSQAL